MNKISITKGKFRGKEGSNSNKGERKRKGLHKKRIERKKGFKDKKKKRKGGGGGGRKSPDH